jgi:CBS domain-containing protein
LDILKEPIWKHCRCKLYTIDQSASVAEAAKIMKQNSIGSVLILAGDDAIGIVTQRDIINRVVARGKNPSEIKVSTIMSTPLITINKDETLEKALDVMEKNKIRRIVVVDEKNKLYGISVELKICGDLLDEQIGTSAPEVRSWLDRYVTKFTDSQLKRFPWIEEELKT